MKLTDRQVRNLKPRPDRYELWEGNGLGVRVTPNGTKTWVFLYRYQGKPRRMTLGRYPNMTVAQAHEAHGKALANLEKGSDPGAMQVEVNRSDRGALTVAALAEEYIEKWAVARKRSWREDKRILDKDVLPSWGRRKAKDIARRDVVSLLDVIVGRGSPIAANRTLALVRKMFNFALSRDIIPTSPCLGVRAPSGENQRERVLSENEIRALWIALDTVGSVGTGRQERRLAMAEPTAIALKLQLVTAQRSGEVVGAAREEFDLASGWWIIPANKSKNKLPHRVPLSPLAVRLIERAMPLAPHSPYLVPSPRGNQPMAQIALSHALKKNLATLGIAPFTPHDLRRTAASHMTGMGIPRLVVSKILNHVESGITAVYDRHSYDQEKRAALEGWALRLQEIMAGERTTEWPR